MRAIVEREAQKLIGSNRKEIDEMREKFASFENGRLEDGLASLLRAKTTFMDGTVSLLEKVHKVNANKEEITELGRLLKGRIDLITEINSVAIRELKKRLEEEPGFQDMINQATIKTLSDEIHLHEITARLAEGLISGKQELHEMELTKKGIREFRRMLMTKRMD
jgi:hypothetical protein